MSSATSRYDRVSIALHWMIGIGIILIGGTEIVRHEFFAKGSALRESLKLLHQPAGVVLLGLIFGRLAWRLAHRAPIMPAGMNGWELTAAKLTHWMLHGLLVVVPMLGLLGVAARGKPIDFGLFQLALPVALTAAAPAAKLLKETHEVAALLILGLAGLHAAAALWHHYIRRDDVLARMLPRPRT